MRATSYQEVLSGDLLEPVSRFDRAICMAQTNLQELQVSGHIVGSTIFGSAISRAADGFTDADPLSDLDVVAITTDRSPRHFNALRDMTSLIFSTTAVQLEIVALSQTAARTGNHNLLPPMVDWLGRQPEQYPAMTIGEQPGAYLARPRIDTLETVAAWLLRVSGGMDKVSDHASASLAWSLSIPHIATRKTLDGLAYSDASDVLKIVRPQRYTKAEMLEWAAVHYRPHSPLLFARYEQLQRIKQEFLGFIMDTVVTGAVSEATYDATIDTMAEAAQLTATDFLNQMLPSYQAMRAAVVAGNHEWLFDML
jgi:hypothetical protein